MNTETWLIIAHGEPLPSQQLQELAQKRGVLVTDGAVKSVLEANITPNVVLGDFDSINKQLLAQLESDPSTKVILTEDQNKTDCEKAIQYLDSQGATDIIICQATGLRLDHSLYNLRLLARLHHPNRALQIITATESYLFIKNNTITLSGKIGSNVAILGFDQATITTTGLTYDTNNLTIGLPGSDSVSNKLKTNHATINVTEQALLIIDSQITVKDKKHALR